MAYCGCCNESIVCMNANCCLDYWRIMLGGQVVGGCLDYGSECKTIKRTRVLQFARPKKHEKDHMGIGIYKCLWTHI